VFFCAVRAMAVVATNTRIPKEWLGLTDVEYVRYRAPDGTRRKKKKVTEWMKIMGEKEESSESEFPEDPYEGFSLIYVRPEEVEKRGVQHEVVYKQIALRLAPSIDGKVIGVASKGDVLKSFGRDESGQWRRVHFKLPMVNTKVWAWALVEHRQLGPLLKALEPDIFLRLIDEVEEKTASVSGFDNAELNLRLADAQNEAADLERENAMLRQCLMQIESRSRERDKKSQFNTALEDNLAANLPSSLMPEMNELQLASNKSSPQKRESDGAVEFFIGSPEKMEQQGIAVQADDATPILLLFRAEIDKVALKLPACTEKNRQGPDEWEKLMNPMLGKQVASADKEEGQDLDASESSLEFISSQDALTQVRKGCVQYEVVVRPRAPIHSKPTADSFLVGHVKYQMRIDAFEDDKTGKWCKVYCQVHPSGKLFGAWVMKTHPEGFAMLEPVPSKFLE